MRIARFVTGDGEVAYGVPLNDDSARRLPEGPFSRETSDEIVRVERFLPPIEPPNVFAIGRNYRAHAEETGSQVPAKPLVFIKATTSLLGHEGRIILPESAPESVDFEAELAIVIGRTARRVPKSAALDYVLGYTCANDVSARDCQRADKQWTRAKGFDTFCPLGPWLVTADALDPGDCVVRSRVNGEIMQEAPASDMLHDCGELISYLSRQFTLLPGTVILTGTPQGVGVARTPPVFLRPGDRVEVEIEGIGTLRNSVGATIPQSGNAGR